MYFLMTRWTNYNQIVYIIRSTITSVYDMMNFKFLILAFTFTTLTSAMVSCEHKHSFVHVAERLSLLIHNTLNRWVIHLLSIKRCQLKTDILDRKNFTHIINLLLMCFTSVFHRWRKPPLWFWCLTIIETRFTVTHFPIASAASILSTCFEILNHWVIHDNFFRKVFFAWRCNR